ncbi:MAG: RidA family protein [Candidatus Dormibacter sp.]|uniref:RidA family protein n=1 Tax=Candidatus Dormibacter sp. TaxID=2973982 RepID=UPI000DB6DFC6|nr:MAG: hypothetical protein DLM66_15315 [Candidatus Dormibacteraeota bacterium]
MSSAADRLRELGLQLPAAPAAMASYVPTVQVPIADGRSLLYISGQVASQDGRLLTGRVPDEVDLAHAQEAARCCALTILAQLDSTVGLDKVERLVNLTVWVNCTSDFTEQPTVANGASDLLVQVLGESGKHTRAAVGACGLPKDVTVEIGAIALVRR